MIILPTFFIDGELCSNVMVHIIKSLVARILTILSFKATSVVILSSSKWPFKSFKLHTPLALYVIYTQFYIPLKPLHFWYNFRIDLFWLTTPIPITVIYNNYTFKKHNEKTFNRCTNSQTTSLSLKPMLWFILHPLINNC